MILGSRGPGSLTGAKYFQMSPKKVRFQDIYYITTFEVATDNDWRGGNHYPHPHKKSEKKGWQWTDDELAEYQRQSLIAHANARHMAIDLANGKQFIDETIPWWWYSEEEWDAAETR